MVLRALSKCLLNMISNSSPKSENISGLCSVPARGGFPDVFLKFPWQSQFHGSTKHRLGRFSGCSSQCCQVDDQEIVKILLLITFLVPLRILQFKFLVQSNLNTLAESQLTVFINPFVCISINIFHNQLETLVMELSFEMLGGYFSVNLRKQEQ